MVILIDRQGGLRMLASAGWSLAALTAEFGASAVFRVNKGQGVTSVEGWAGADRCLIERQNDSTRSGYLLRPPVDHPVRLHQAPVLIAES